MKERKNYQACHTIRIIKEYYEQLYTNQSDNLDETDKF